MNSKDNERFDVLDKSGLMSRRYRKTRFDSDGLMAAKIAMKKYRYRWNLL